MNIAIYNQPEINTDPHIVAISEYSLPAATHGKQLNHTISVPAETQDGDMMIFMVQMQGLGGAHITSPGEVDSIQEYFPVGAGREAQWFKRTASSEPASYTFGSTIIAHVMIRLLIIRNVSSVTTGTLTTVFNGNTIEAPSVTLPVPGLLLAYFLVFIGALQTVVSTPSGMNEVDTSLVKDTQFAIYVNETQIAGPTGVKSFAYSGGNHPVGLQIYLIP